MKSNKKNKQDSLKGRLTFASYVLLFIPYAFPFGLLCFDIVHKQKKWLKRFTLVVIFMILGTWFVLGYREHPAYDNFLTLGLFILVPEWFFVLVYMTEITIINLRSESKSAPLSTATIPPLNEVEKLGTKLIRNLKKWKKEIESVPLQEDIEELIQICGIVMKRNDAEAWKFFTTYSDTLDTMLGKYDEIENTRLNSPEMLQTMDLIEKSIGEIVVAFRNEVNDMYKKDMIHLNAETKAFMYNLKRKGLIE